MVYECDQCAKPLPAGVTACPNCGERFDDAVPADASIPGPGFRPALVQPAPAPVSPPAYAPSPVAPALQRPPQAGLNKPVSPAWLVFALVVAALVVISLVGSGTRELSDAKTHEASYNHAINSLMNPSAGSTAPDPSPAPAVPDDSPQMRVGSENFTKESSFDIVAGEVTNISGHPLESVEAVTTFYDGSGNVVKTEDALIDFNPILPGQTSPYKTMATDDPAITREKTVFQIMGGGQVETTNAPASSGPHSSGHDSPGDASADTSSADSSSSRDALSEKASAGSGLSDEPLSRSEVESSSLSRSDLTGKSLAALSISYNTIYAIHGYVFKRRSLQRVFDAESWYHPDPTFDEAGLSATEKANLKTIRSYEKSRFGY